MATADINHFQQNLLRWFDQFGRKDLPWQQPKDAYRIWVSEIMLQQTQVNTVIPYFHRFMAKFPTLASLAMADQAEVLHLWTGLGYYARARNLHKTARIIQADFQGKLPKSLDQLMVLPGIGRSTAAAILSLSYGLPHAILDGNVKRILSRFFKVGGWTGDQAVIKQLWALADSVTPKQRCADFNQAMMDLGASLCSRSKPQCQLCPLNSGCQAYLTHQTSHYPQAKPKKSLPERAYYFLMLIDTNGAVLLEKRPPTGIWGGLWSLPQLLSLTEIEPWLEQQHLRASASRVLWQPFKHTFTHFHLQIKPVYIEIDRVKEKIDPDQYCWCKNQDNEGLGMPAPIIKLLQALDTLRRSCAK